MAPSSCLNDDTLGPAVKGCRGDFDFTLKFEELAFAIAPSVIFIGFAAWRVLGLSQRPICVHAPVLRFSKLGIAGGYTLLSIVLLSLVAASLALRFTNLTVPAAAVQIVEGMAITILSQFEHARSIRPSTLLGLYLPLTLALSAARTRTMWLVAADKLRIGHAAVFSANLAIRAVMMLIEAQGKGEQVDDRHDQPARSPEETSNIYSLGVFFWLNGLFRVGYRKTLQLSDLYPLDRAMAATSLSDPFWKRFEGSNGRGKRHGLARALASTLLPKILRSVAPRLALVAFTFCQPLMINRILSLLGGSETSQTTNYKYGLIGAAALIYSGIAVSTALYWYYHYRTLIAMRGILVSAIYTQASQLHAESGDRHASVTLMSVDIERIVQGFAECHEAWASLIEVAIASWLLYNQLGFVFVVPMIVVAVCFASLSILLRYTSGSQKAWMAAVQERVGYIAFVIANMRSIKAGGLIEPIADTVQSLRVDELKAGSRFRSLNLIGTVLSLCPLLVSPILTFAFSQRELGTTVIFTSLSYLVLLATPLQVFLSTMPLLVAGFACFGRIQAFLEKPRRVDFRNAPPPPPPPDVDGSSRAAVVISGGHFGWESGRDVLKGINIAIPKRCITMVVGPVAAGKSTLCKALLGEVPYSTGDVYCAPELSKVGYCDQEVFLSNSSIRDNIICFSPYNPERYSEVIDAAMLRPDLEILPQGDMASVGSNGIGLSGGQRQRIALARALYTQSNTLILDDIFSGLDADTEAEIVKKLFEPHGLLRKRNMTVILSTHSFRHLPLADHVIILDSNGTVSAQGSHEEVAQTSSFLLDSPSREASSETLKVHGQATGRKENHLSEKPTSDDAELLIQAKPAKRESVQPPEKGAERTTLIAENMTEGSKYKYYAHMGFILASSMVWAAAFFGFFYNFPTVWLKYWSEDITNPQPKHSFSFYVGLYAFFQISCLLSIAGLGWFIWVVSTKKAGAALHGDILRTLIRAPLSFLTRVDQGIITNLFSQDLNLLDTQLPNALLNLLYNLSVALGQAVVMATESAYVAVSYPFILGAMWLIQKVYLKTSKQLRILDLELKSPLYTKFLDTVKGIVTLRALDSISQEHAHCVALLDNSQRPFYLLIVAQQWLRLVLNSMVTVIAVILVTLALELRTNSGFTGASLVTLMSFGDIISSIVMQWTKLETSLGAVERLKTFVDTVESENTDHETTEPPPEWPDSGKIQLMNVSATYRLEDDLRYEHQDLVLRDIDLAIAPGKKVALCGRTGSGKSSILAFLLKLLDPVPGSASRALIDGIDLQCIDRATLRRRIIALPQDTILLPSAYSFKQNLDPLDLANEEQCQAALELVNLWQLIQARGGLNARMDSSTLSQGQRQIFSLARTVLRRRTQRHSSRGILLLDEISSSVDQETESLMQRVIKTEFEKYTIVAVSHRLDLIMDFDSVVVLDRGRIVETGNPRELVQLGNSCFAQLFQSTKKGDA